MVKKAGDDDVSERTEALKAVLAAARGRLVITGHDTPDVDSVVSCVLMKGLLDAWGIAAQIVLPTPADKQAHRVMARSGIDVDAWRGEVTAADGLVLVDHHRPLHPGEVLACVDHHPTDYPPRFPYVQIEPSGACALMVLRLWEEAGVPVTRLARELAVTALYLDTIALRSAKIPPEEAQWAGEQAARLGMDVDWLMREGMGLRDMSLPARTLAMLGKKVYDFGGKRVCSTYVQTNGMTREKLGEILTVLKEAVVLEEACLWVFLVHDPVAMRSSEYDITPDGGVQMQSYEYLASRGKDVMPCVERRMRGERA